MNNIRKKEPRPISDAQRKRFFYLLKLAGYNLPYEKDQAYADLGIYSIKDKTAVEMELILRQLQRVVNQKTAAAGGAVGYSAPKYAESRQEEIFDSIEERFEAWRSEFFPENVLAFGSARSDRQISEKQTRFIIINAGKIFKNRSNFRAWLHNQTGYETIATQNIANQASRGLTAMAERGGYDPAPPMASSNRRDWELRHPPAAGTPDSAKEKKEK